ncbi:MAG TPA: (2Fe-2S)-binding protein [Actinospica sp.]|nr:(2Fe-2S)-binding protein [Actinospica sp.]
MAATVTATRLTDPTWLAEQVDLQALLWKTDDRRVLATLWWYSASTVLVAPSLSALVATGVARSPRLQDTVLQRHPSGRLLAARSTAVLGPDITELGSALESTLGTIIDALGPFTGGRTRPLWAIGTDAIANSLLWAGRESGCVDEATGLAAPIAAAAPGSRLPVPRYVDVPRASAAPPARFVRRASCCLLYRVPGQSLCTSCPRRDPAERLDLLRAAAG